MKANHESTDVLNVFDCLTDMAAMNVLAGKYTVPVFWDKKTGTIVNNESSEILRFLNAEFQDLAKNPELDLYPKELRQDIDAVNDWIYKSALPLVPHLECQLCSTT
jgi:glutathionyl-hydroquinone reductase